MPNMWKVELMDLLMCRLCWIGCDMNSVCPDDPRLHLALTDCEGRVADREGWQSGFGFWVC